MFTPLQKRMLVAAGELLKSSQFARGGWIPDGSPPCISESKLDKTVAFHISGLTALGPIMLNIFFNDVDEAEGTFKVNPQIIFAGRNGKLEPGQDDYCPQIFWGGSLGWRVPF